MVQRREKLVFNSGGPILYLLSLEYVKLKSLAVPAQNATGPCGVYLTYPLYIFSCNSIVFSFNYWCNFQSNLNNSLPLFKNDVVRTLALPFLITYLTYLKTASALSLFYRSIDALLSQPCTFLYVDMFNI